MRQAMTRVRLGGRMVICFLSKNRKGRSGRPFYFFTLYIQDITLEE
jgi:hypothetical protein